jgi:hypothetical protein
MAIITVGPNTPLAGTKIFVDNNDPSLQYSGSWAESQDGFDAGTLPDGLPVGNTTQRTTSIGDTMTFRFSGGSAFKVDRIRRQYKHLILQERQFQSMEYFHGQTLAASLQHTPLTVFLHLYPIRSPQVLLNMCQPTKKPATSCFSTRRACLPDPIRSF